MRRSGSEEATRSSSSIRRVAAPLLRPPPTATAATAREEPKPREAAVAEGQGKDEAAQTREVIVERGGKEDEGGDEGTTVKWDECEVVDAVVLGDAIESFLKGKASFRRTKKERRAKSDA